jgi:hypothetical protein
MILPSADVEMYAVAFPRGFTSAYLTIHCPNKELFVVIVWDIETTL